MAADLMSPDIIILSHTDESDWQSYVDSHIEASIYHTLEWRDILFDEYRFEPVYLMAKEGEKVVGVLPLFLIKNLRGRRLVSLPFSIYGGPLAETEGGLSALMAKCVDLVNNGMASYVEIKPRAQIDVAAKLGFETVEWGEGVIIDLTVGIEELWRNFNERFNVGKAERKGLKFILTDSKRLSDFYQLHLMTRKRLGLPTPSFNYYVSFFKKMRGKVKLTLVEKDGRVIAGNMFLLFKDNILLVLNASNHNYRDCKPNDFMIWNILKWSFESGFKSLDQGPASFEDDSLLRYKKKWGGESVKAFHYYYPVVSDKGSRTKGNSLFRVLPSGIAGSVGSKVIKYFV